MVEHDMAEKTNAGDRYRSLSDEIAASAAVITVSARAGLQAITVDSYLDVSYDPPTMAVCVYAGSRISEALDVADTLTLSVLADDQKSIAQRLGEPGQPAYGRLASIPTEPGTDGPDHIKGCVAYFELELTKTVDIATHTLYVGRVAMCGRGKPRAEPLIYRGGEYLGTTALHDS